MAPIGPAAQPPAPAGNDIEEIVVTAQRRGENLQTVPISVTAITGRQLQGKGIQNTQDLTLSVPGLNFARSTTAAQPTLRGIGSRSATTANEGNVAVYVDGVYQAQPFANFFQLSDIEQIEVLKGPQGTLYGRNALGGAISIRTRSPSFTPTGDFAANYGSFDARGVTGYVTGPIAGDTLAASLSGAASKDNGYIHNIFLGGKQGNRSFYNARGKLLFRPSDRAELQLTGAWLRGTDTSNDSGFWYNGNSYLRTTANPTNIPTNILIPTNGYDTASGKVPTDKLTNINIDLHGKYDFDGATLTGLVGWKKSKLLNDGDNSAEHQLPVLLYPHSRSWYAETVLTSRGTSRITWLFGLNYFYDHSQTDPQIVLVTKQFNGVTTNAVSGFGELTWNPLDKLFLTGGLRASYEKKDAFADIVAPAASVASAASSHHWSSLTPRAVARYQFTANTNVYASFSQGFKSGAFDTSTLAGALTPVNPEKVNAYEVGFKTQLMRNLRFNLAAYHYDYRDLQVVVIVGGTNGTIGAQLQNAANSRINGLEAEAQFQVTHDLRLSGTLSYLDAKFTSFPAASVLQIKYVNGLPSGNVTALQDVKGKSLIRSPKFTGTVSLDYQHPLLGGTLLLNTNLFHSTRYYTDVNNLRFQPEYTVVNGSITWQAPRNKWSLSVSGRNLTNERYVTQIYSSSQGDYATYQQPRSVTGTIAYHF